MNPKPKTNWINRPQFQSGDRVILPDGQIGKLTSKDDSFWIVQLPNRHRVRVNQFDLTEAP